MIELVALLGIFICSLFLIYYRFELSVYILLVLSLLLHKELFSFYSWDLLPIRAFMGALICAGGLRTFNYLKTHDFKPTSLFQFFKDPFIFFVSLLWLVRGVSLVFSMNLKASILLFVFFTGVCTLLIWFYLAFKTKKDAVLKYLHFYVFLVFLLTLFGYFQVFLYYKTGIIIGALWNIPDNLPRVGSTFWDVNHYAALLGTLLPVVTIFTVTSKSWKMRLFNGFMAVSMLGAYLLTNSRSGWIIGAFSFLFFVIFLVVKKIGYKGIAYVFITLLLIALPFLYQYNQKDSKFRADIRQYFHYRLDSFDSHFLLLTGAYQVFEEYPILGGGYGSFFEHFSKTKIAPEYFGRDPAALNTRVPAHTIWGELLADTGIIGLNAFILLFGVLIIVPFFVGWTEKSFELSLLPFALASTIIGWLIGGIFYSYNSEFFWLVISLFFVYAVSSLQVHNKWRSLFDFVFTNAKLPLIVLSTLAALLIFVGLGSNQLIPWDEAIYAKVAKNMVTSGDWLSLHWDMKALWFEKPPLYMWLSAMLMSVFGFSSIVPRLPSAIFGFLLIIVTYKFASKMFNRTAGYIAGLSLLTNVAILYYSRASMLDVTATFFMTSALFFYAKARSKYLFTDSTKEALSNWVLAGLFIGIGAMVKGVVGLLPLLCIGVFEIFLLVTEQIDLKSFIKNYFVMFSASLLTFLPWHLYMYYLYGPIFLQNYIGYHVLDRATKSIEDKGKPLWWYLEVMKVFMRVWFVALIPAGVYATFKCIKLSNKHVFLSVSSLVILLFFSVATSKLVWYIIPIYPLLGIIIGEFVDWVYTKLTWVYEFSEYRLVKILALYFITVFVLSYLFFVRSMVYTSDTTGSQARLLMAKDAFFGMEQKVFVDRIELPLVMYYTDGPFEIYDIEVTKGRYPFISPTEKLVLLTKKGRYSPTLPNRNSEAIVYKEDGDYVLWYFKPESL